MKCKKETRRIVLLKCDDGEFRKYHFRKLKNGDEFMLLEPDGEVIKHKGKTVFKCGSDAYNWKDGVWGVEAV